MVSPYLRRRQLSGSEGARTLDVCGRAAVQVAELCRIIMAEMYQAHQIVAGCWTKGKPDKQQAAQVSTAAKAAATSRMPRKSVTFLG